MAGRRALNPVPDDLPTVDGRVPGARGRATRDRLLACVARLLDRTSYRDLSVSEIAQCAGTSPATFYQYFQDVEAAVLVLAQALADRGHHLTDVIEGSDWDGEAGAAAALELTDAFFALWEEHRAVLRVVDLATAEGDMRFQNIRTRLLNRVTESLHHVIRESKRHGRHPRDVDPLAQAAALVSMLAHVAAHRYGFEFWGIRTDDVRRSMARQLYWGITGQKPPT
jgi:AcrR family transcriptional regulator